MMFDAREERGNSRKLRKREFVPPRRERTRGIAVRAIPLPTGGAMHWAVDSRGRIPPRAEGDLVADAPSPRPLAHAAIDGRARFFRFRHSLGLRGGSRAGGVGGERGRAVRKRNERIAARVARFPRRGSNIPRFRKRSVAAAPRVIRAPARSETRRGDAFGSRAGSTREETAGSAVASRRNARETRGGVTHVIVVLALVVRGRTAVSRGRHLAFDERGHVQRAVCRGDARVSE